MKDKPAILGLSTNAGLHLASVTSDLRKIQVFKIFAPHYCIYNSLPIRKNNQEGETERVLLGIW